MGLTIHLLGVLCAIGAATLAAVSGPRWAGPIGASVGFAAGAAWLGFGAIVSPGLAGLVAAGAAGLVLARPAWAPLAAVAAGLLAAFWVPVLRLQGLTIPVAVGLAILVPLAAILLSFRGARFAPLAELEGALLLVVAVGLALAAAPQVAQGWRSAGIMNLEYATQAVPRAGAGIVGALTGILALGGGYALWWRRH